jgi:uncharacterized protein
MKRDLLKYLTIWKDSRLRKPLLLRGARQVGKSWLVRTFAKSFDHFIEVNFEKNINAKTIFTGDIKIGVILKRLAIFGGKPIIPGKTLLFLDEIQECEQALLTLRYFKEELPELHVIAAGSLLDFTIEKMGMPVGRVQYMYLYPLSFAEFLAASHRDDLRSYIQKKNIDPLVYDELLEFLRTYMWLGGMPAVVESWLTGQNPIETQEIQDEIIQTYQDDFEKYARKNQVPYVEKLFQSIPLEIGNKFKYTNIDKDMPARPLKNALNLLEKAGIIYRCYHSAGQRQPLGADKDLRKFKVFFFDTGLAQRILGLNIQDWILQPINTQKMGNITENFVAQEITAYSSVKKKTELFYWHREAKNSNAEIDFLIVKEGLVIPVEVKSGNQGGMKSLHLFLESHANTTYGIKISEAPFAEHGNIKDIPLYALESLAE